MRSMHALSVALVVAAWAWPVKAEDKATPAKPAVATSAKLKAKTRAQHEAKYQMVTGSYIPRRVNKNGMVTDGPSPVAVIDQQTMGRLGAQTVREALIRAGRGR